MVKKFLKYLSLTLVSLILIIVLTAFYLYLSADMKSPSLELQPKRADLFTDSLRVYGDNWLHLNSNGLWEMKIGGNAVERGEATGVLAQDLLYYQERVFVDKIREFIPSEGYLRFLRALTLIFNRNLGENVPDEYREEIYAISQYCSHEFDLFGTPYERQLNYHAAHDIGHAMQDYMMVGCSSFACWGGWSADSSLIIGRNFDFYMGDEFARNRVVAFVSPEKGYRFVSVCWPGMIGLLSGMNEKGLTVTINAAKSDIPTSSATPISLLVRKILQYASTIEQAYAIANEYRTFVSESILVGSAIDKKGALIEKSPDKIALFYSDNEKIISTNHFQSPLFSNDKRNMENIATSDSPARFARIEELLKGGKPTDLKGAASILRDTCGVGGKSIGLGNESALNQLLAHHSVIFKPEELKIWVSTSPWQCGEFICYDLKRVFSLDTLPECVASEGENIPASDFVASGQYDKFLKYKELLNAVKHSTDCGRPIGEDSLRLFVGSNPNFYYVYKIIGDYYRSSGEYAKAVSYWEMALQRTIPKADERIRIEKSIEKAKNEKS